ncbi:MAG: DUF5685 family protein [Clostridioides sp.]|jgi:hypothetical protein|nr:DUF5685 family protein [Clostridioides sp.]
MFGYVKINKMDLTFREYDHYKSYYCGLCKCLKRTHGEISRLSLNFDITFLIVLLSSVYRPKANISEEICIVSPFKKKKILINEITEYAADMNVLLTYYKLEDDVIDDKDFKSKIAFNLFKGNHKSAYERYPEKAEYMKAQLEHLRELENEDCDDIDEVSNIFGNLMGEIFAYRKDEYEERLRFVGFNIGKYIYTLDAYEDLDEDIAKNRYNPFKSYRTLNLGKENDLNSTRALNLSKTKFARADVDESIKNKDFAELKEVSPSTRHALSNRVDNIIGMTLGFLGQSVDSLDLKYNRGIIENIIYSGVYLRYKGILKKGDERSVQ